MQRLWQDYRQGGAGVERESIQQLVSELAGEDLGAWLETLIYGTDELPLLDLLAEAGIEVTQRVASNAQDKGGKAASGDLPGADLGAALKDGDDGLSVVRVVEQGALQLAGLSAGDVIIAVDGLKLNLASLEGRQLRAKPGDRWQLHAFRRDELHQFEVVLQTAPSNTAVLAVADAERARLGWLGV